MLTPFALLLGRCGLSHREAAELLAVRLDTVKSWSTGRNRAPAGAITALRGIYARIDQAAAETLALIRQQAPEEIEIGIATDDHEARSLGWPCVGAHAALAGLVVARCGVPARIVPRGSTVATAAAADTHGQ